MKLKIFRTLALLGALTVVGCDPARVYDDNQDLPDNIWRVSEKPTFDFEITDPAATYTVKLNVRYAPFYPFHNLFTRLRLTGPNGQVVSFLRHELNLFAPTTGEPLGDGLGDIYDHQVSALRHVRFPQKGTYHAQLEQDMRVAQLDGVMAVGIRVEREGVAQ